MVYAQWCTSTCMVNRKLLNVKYKDRLRSLHLNPVDYFIWGHLKTIIYHTLVTNEKDLRNRLIYRYTAIWNPHSAFERGEIEEKIRCMYYSWYQSYIFVTKQKSSREKIIFKKTFVHVQCCIRKNHESNNNFKADTYTYLNVSNLW